MTVSIYVLLWTGDRVGATAGSVAYFSGLITEKLSYYEEMACWIQNWVNVSCWLLELMLAAVLLMNTTCRGQVVGAIPELNLLTAVGLQT